MSKITKARKQELLELASARFNMHGPFDYHNWDDAIECDESITEAELRWLAGNAEVLVVERE